MQQSKRAQKDELRKTVQLKTIHEFFPIEKTYYRDKLGLTQENKLPRYINSLTNSNLILNNIRIDFKT